MTPQGLSTGWLVWQALAASPIPNAPAIRNIVCSVIRLPPRFNIRPFNFSPRVCPPTFVGVRSRMKVVENASSYHRADNPRLDGDSAQEQLDCGPRHVRFSAVNAR